MRKITQQNLMQNQDKVEDAELPMDEDQKMRNRIFIAPAGLMGFLLAACTTGDAPVLTWVGEAVSIEVNLTGIRHSTTGEMLHGDLRAVGTSGKLKAIDLRCVGIAKGSMSSRQTYVSSYIDIIPSGYRANSKGIVEVDW